MAEERTSRTVLKADAIGRAWRRVAHEIAETHADELPLIAQALPDLLALGGDDIFESGSRHLVDGLRAETVHVER